MNQGFNYIAGKFLITIISILAIIGLNAILENQYDKIIEKEKKVEEIKTRYLKNQAGKIKSLDSVFPLSVNWDAHEHIFEGIENDNIKSGNFSDLPAHEIE